MQTVDWLEELIAQGPTPWVRDVSLEPGFARGGEKPVEVRRSFIREA